MFSDIAKKFINRKIDSYSMLMKEQEATIEISVLDDSKEVFRKVYSKPKPENYFNFIGAICDIKDYHEELGKKIASEFFHEVHKEFYENRVDSIMDHFTSNFFEPLMRKDSRISVRLGDWIKGEVKIKGDKYNKGARRDVLFTRGDEEFPLTLKIALSSTTVDGDFYTVYDLYPNNKKFDTPNGEETFFWATDTLRWFLKDGEITHVNYPSSLEEDVMNYYEYNFLGYRLGYTTN